MIARRKTNMAVTYETQSGRWVAGCTRCWWRSTKVATEDQARHTAAQHLWGQRRQPHQPRGCGTPEKRHHLTVDSARRHIVKLYARGLGNPDYNAYLCRGGRGVGCGWYHVGHSKRHLDSRIRQAVRR